VRNFQKIFWDLVDWHFPKKNPNQNIGLDDLDDIELLQYLEEYFEIKISDAQANAMTNIGEMYECIQCAVSQKGNKLDWEQFLIVIREHCRIPISDVRRETEFHRYISRRKK
jgi:hypothetical protein